MLIIVLRPGMFSKIKITEVTQSRSQATGSKPTGNAGRHESETTTATQPATKVHAQPATSYSETM